MTKNLASGETDDLFNGETEPLLYRGINITEDINDLYRENLAFTDGDFVRAVSFYIHFFYCKEVLLL